MSCETINNLMMRYFDSSLNKEEEDILMRHVECCPNCAEEFNSMKEIFDCLEDEDCIEPPLNFEASVMEKVNAYEDSRRKRIDNFLMIAYSTTFAIIGVIMVLISVYFKNHSLSEDSSTGLQGMLWNVVFFSYSLMRQIFSSFEDSFNWYVGCFTIGIVIIMYNMIRKSENKTQQA